MKPKDAWKYIHPSDPDQMIDRFKFCKHFICKSTGKVGFYNLSYISSEHVEGFAPAPAANLADVNVIDPVSPPVLSTVEEQKEDDNDLEEQEENDDDLSYVGAWVAMVHNDAPTSLGIVSAQSWTLTPASDKVSPPEQQSIPIWTPDVSINEDDPDSEKTFVWYPNHHNNLMWEEPFCIPTWKLEAPNTGEPHSKKGSDSEKSYLWCPYHHQKGM